MTDNTSILQDDSESQNQWVTPDEAATILGVRLRSVYRLIDAKRLVSDGAAHGQKIRADTVETERIRRLAKNAVDAQIDQQETQPRQKQTPQAQNDSLALMAVSSAYSERDKALAKVDELQERWRQELAEISEARRQDALTIGQLTERVKNLERQLEAPETRQDAPGAAQNTQGIETTTQQDVTTQNAPIKRRRWWQL